MDKYKVPSTLHIEQARRLVEMIEQRGEGGHESLMAIVTELKRFGSGEVSFDPDLISPFAVKEEIENGWKAVEQEIEALYSHLKAMIEEVEGTKRTNDEMTQKMQKQFAVIQNLYTDAQAVIDAKERIRTSSEFFLSDQNIDYDRIAGEPLQVRGGSVALPYATDPVVLNANVRATIVPGTYTDGYGILGTESNGFPGNNHEVRKNAAQGLSTESGMNGMTFIGETDRAADLSAILDANEESRFEYERVYMRPTEQELIARGKGLDYEVTDGKRIPYLGEEEPLRLSILLTLDTARWVNEIDIRPFIPTNYGAKAPLVKDILVGKEYEPPVSVLKKEPVANEWVFRFKPVFATTVIIQLVQETAYPTDLGHIAYELVKESEGQRLSIDNEEKTLAPTKPIVVDGPAIPVSDMGFKVEQGNDGLKVNYASQGMGDLRAKTMTETLRRLQDAINPKERRVALYRVEGARKVIGIRDILVKEAVYLDKGELVTKPIHFDEPLTRVTLEADATPERNEAGVEIRYHVSVDDGVEWHEIQPMNSELGDAPKMYRIVQDDSDVEPEVPVIRTSRDVYEVRFKMTMERVGVSGQSGPTKVPDTPELFMYRMLAETKPKTRASKTPQILPPQRLKGNVIGGGGKVEDTGGKGPSFEVLPAPVLTLEVSKESCNNVPMKVTASFTHDKPVIEAVVYLDGKEVYREQPGVNQKTINVDVPTSYFAERSRVSVSVTISDGIKDARQLKSVLVVPCQDAGGRDIDISAGYPEVGQPWTVSGFARSTTDIDKVTLYINGTSYPVENLGLVWREKERVEFIKVFSPEEVEAMGFTVGQSIELKWVAKDVQAQEWDDILVLQYVDRRPPTIDCGQVTYLGVTYYDWNLGGFQTKGISVPNWDQEVKSFDDGRGIKTLIGWNELMAAPVLMVRSGIGETGGVIIGQVELRYRKLVDGSLSSEETTVFMQGALESDMTEAVDLAYGQKDLSQMAATIKRTGRFTGMPRLMGLNAYLVPDFGDEYRANVCGVGITEHSFEPTDNILLPGTVEETGAACESNTMFLIEYYDKTLGRRVLHGQKRDGDSPQVTIFLPDVEEHEVVLKWSDTKTGVAVLTKSANTKGLVVTALGVLVRSAKLEARYGIGYIESVGYQPEDQTFAVRKPTDPLEVADLYADGEPVPELTGVDAKLFLSVKPRDMIACAVDPDDPGVKQDEQPPTIEASTTMLPGNGERYCLQDIPNEGIPLMFTVADDVKLSSYEVYHNGALLYEKQDVNTQSDIYSRNVLFDKEQYMSTGPETMGKADIVFSVDTSGSMDTHIATVKQKMGEFKQYLIENNVDAYLGAMDSRDPHAYVVPLTPAASADFSGLATNGGGWETNNWNQVLSASDLFANARVGAKKVIILVTDTYIGTQGTSAPPTVTDYVEDNNIQVSALAFEAHRTQYETLTSITDGVFLDLASNPDMSALAQGVGAVTGLGESFTVIATDTSGKMATKTFKYDFMDCWDGTGEDEIIVAKSAKWRDGESYGTYDTSNYITFDQLEQSNMIEVKYRVRAEQGITETGFNDWGTGVTQVTGEFGISKEKITYSPQVYDTGVQTALLPIPTAEGRPIIRMEASINECVLVFDTRAEFMPHFNANRAKILEMIKKDFQYGDTRLFKRLPYDPGQVPYEHRFKYIHYRTYVKRRLHLMTIGTNGVEHRHYENPMDVSLDWIQERPDAVWGGSTNKVFMDTLNKLKTFKGEDTNVSMNYIGYSLPVETTDANKEEILRPVMDILEADDVRIRVWTTDSQGTNPSAYLKWPELSPEKNSWMQSGSFVFATVTEPNPMDISYSTFSLNEAMETVAVRSGVIRRYMLRYKTPRYTNGWVGGEDPIWVIVLDERYKSKYAYTNGYTDNQATEVTG